MSLSHSSRVLSEGPLKCNHNVPRALFKVITMDSQYSPILTQTLKEIIEYVARYIVIAFRGPSERTLDEWLRLMVDTC